MTVTEIAVERTTGADVFTNDQSDPPLTRDRADLVAERFMDLLLDRLEEAYPEATIRAVAGNGLGGGTSVSADSCREEDDATARLHDIAMRLWESAELWSVVNADA